MTPMSNLSPTDERATLTDERLKELLAACVKATPGPWKPEMEQDEEDDLPAFYVSSPATSCNLTVVARRGEYNQNGRVDANYLANCDPATISSLIQELLSLRQKDGEMVEALRGPVMWAEVVQDEYTGDIVWRCNEADNRDGPHDEPMIELNPATFPLGTKINITEPALSTLSPQEPDNG